MGHSSLQGRLEETSGVARKRGQSVAGLNDHGQELVLDPEKLRSHRIGAIMAFATYRVEDIVNLWSRRARKEIKIGKLTTGGCIEGKRHSERICPELRAEVPTGLKVLPPGQAGVLSWVKG